MHPHFQVTKEEIQQLDEQQAEDFIAFLCGAEIKEAGLSPSIVTWGGNIKAPDKGIDIRVDPFIKGDRASFILRANTIFQIKVVSNQITASFIQKEMMPNSQLRSKIIALAKDEGAYVLVSTKDDIVAAKIEGHEQEMKACLQTHGLEQIIQVKFYCSQKIADWTNQYPSAITWIKHAAGKAFYGFHPYAPWAYKEKNIEAEYLIDHKTKIIPQNTNTPIAILEAINQLREILSSHKQAIRLVGLSGVGKTRLVQALFDERITTNHPALTPNKVIYTDLSTSDPTKIHEFVDVLLSECKEAILVIDNCSGDMHGKLTEKIIKSNSQLNLITIEYDIREDLPVGTQFYTLESSSYELLEKLLYKQYPQLSAIDSKRIAELSDGNARVAYALSESLQTTDNMASLSDNQLFDRLFLQNNLEDKDILNCAKSCSLLYSFDSEDITENSELSLLASIAGVTTKTLRQYITTIQRRGLIQQRGKWKAVLPHAIANRLAIQFIEDEANEQDILNLCIHPSIRVRTSFSRRLSYLHKSAKAQTIAKKWLKTIKEDLINRNPPKQDNTDEDWLEKIIREKANRDNEKIIKNLAPIIPEEMLTFLKNSCQQNFFEKYYDNSFWAELARSLAYDPAQFSEATNLLMELAIIEKTNSSKNETQARLASLFWIHLSGTIAPASKRLDVIKELFDSDTPIKHEISVENLLKASLKIFDFSSSYTFEFGARKRDFGWQPENPEEQNTWYKTFIEFSIKAGQENTEKAKKVRQLLGFEFYDLWYATNLQPLLKQLATIFHSVDGWPSGWYSIKCLLINKDNKIPEEQLTILKQLENFLSPTTLKEEVEAFIFTEQSTNLAIKAWEDDWYEKSAEQAEQFGKLLGNDKELLHQMLPSFKNIKNSTFFQNFFTGIGKTIAAPIQLFNATKDLISKNPVETKIYLMITIDILAGSYQHKTEQIESFFDQALYDELWSKYFPQLQLTVVFNEKGYTRLIKSLDTDKADIEQYNRLADRDKMNSLSIQQITSLLTKIEQKENSHPVIINILQTLTLNRNLKKPQYKQLLVDYCLSFFYTLDWSKTSESSDYAITKILEFICAQINTNNKEKLLHILNNLIAYKIESDKIHFPRQAEKFLPPFFKYFPKESLDCIYQKNNNGNYHYACNALQYRHDELISSKHKYPLQDVSEETLLNWCAESPEDRFIFMGTVCRLFSTDQETGQKTLSTIAHKLFNSSDNKEAILGAFIQRFYPMSHSGSGSTIIRERAITLNALKTGQDTPIIRLIQQAQDKLEELATKEQQHEEQRNIEIYERFE